ncbi:MAG: hypothetical protein ACJAYD_000934 [Patiriisocius sp.]|jgi:hypothetical protein
MKVLKGVLIFGGIGVFCSGVFSIFHEQETPISQITGMIGIAVLTIVAGIAIKNKR